MENLDFYKILEVDKDASQEDIQKSYKRLAKLYHPDMQHGKSVEEKAAAEEKFKKINLAFETLGDKTKREQYDNGGGFPEGFQFDPTNFGFNPFGGFGRNNDDGFFNFPGFGGFNPFMRPEPATVDPNAPENGKDAKIYIDVSLREVLFGAEREVEVPTVAECSSCHGTGGLNGQARTECKQCSGSGRVKQIHRNGFSTIINEITCPTCGGVGSTVKDKCPVCNGEKYVNVKRKLRLKVPKNAKTTISGTEYAYIFKGQGLPGLRGGTHGDLRVIFREKPDELFEHIVRNGSNVLKTKCYVNPALAMMGGTVEVYTPVGLKKCKIPEKTPPGKVFIVPVSDMPDITLQVEIVYDMPNKMTSKLEKLFGKIINDKDITFEHAGTAKRLFEKFNK